MKKKKPSKDPLVAQVRDHLKEFRPKMYQELAKDGEIYCWLEKMVNRARDHGDIIIKQMLEKNPPLEDKDSLEYRQHMTMIEQIAREFVREELFPPSEKDCPNWY